MFGMALHNNPECDDGLYEQRFDLIFVSKNILFKSTLLKDYPRLYV